MLGRPKGVAELRSMMKRRGFLARVNGPDLIVLSSFGLSS